MSVCSSSTCPPDARQKMSGAHHLGLSLRLRSCISAKETGVEAWRWHLRSLFRRGGHRYLPYTRKLLWAMLASEENRSVTPAKVLVLAIDAASPVLLERWAARRHASQPARVDGEGARRKHS